MNSVPPMTAIRMRPTQPAAPPWWQRRFAPGERTSGRPVKGVSGDAWSVLASAPLPRTRGYHPCWRKSMNLDNTAFAAYWILLIVSGILMLTIAGTGFGTGTAARRALTTVLGMGFVGYGVY